MPEADEPLDLPAPRRFSRRGFVKGCVAATAASLAAAGTGGVVAALDLGGGPTRRVEYVGATVVSGPAPQGVPLVPLALAGDGTVRGNPDPPGVGRAVLDWYRYCGHGSSPVLRPGHRGDETLLYSVPSDKVPAIEALRAEQGGEAIGWFLDRGGRPVRAQDFREVGWGAPVAWRRELTATVLKVDPAALAFPPELRPVVEGFLAPTPDGAALLAFSNFCKHLCCAPGWNESRLAARYHAVDKLYCSCHHSVYDALRLGPDFFVLREA